MGRLLTSIFPGRTGDPPSGRYSDADAQLLLEHAVRELLLAEGGLRQAQRKLDLLAERCHHQGQAALVAAALRDLAGRRPA